MRRHATVAVLAVLLAARLFVVWDAGTEIAVGLAEWIAVYTVTRYGGRRETTIVAMVSVLAAAATVALLDTGLESGRFIEEFSGEVFFVLLAAVGGDAVRTRSEQFTERLEAATATQVHAERLRIAHDLHDVVAHGLSNIAVQSGVASRLLDQNPDHARKALDIINDSSRQSLDELRTMLHLLRSDNDVIELQPTPEDPDDLANLLQMAAKAGLDMTTNVTGTFPPETSTSAIVATHRIIHESLTNIIRHAGPVPTTLEMTHDEDKLELQITNLPGTPTRSTPSTGVGIVGMSERAAAVGGTLTAEHLPQGGFEVKATIPYTNKNGTQT